MKKIAASMTYWVGGGGFGVGGEGERVSGLCGLCLQRASDCSDLRARRDDGS